MKFYKFLLGLAICSASSLFLISCQKSGIVPDITSEAVNQRNSKTSGVVPDDPSKVSKIPMIISADFLKANREALLTDPLKLKGAVSSLAPQTGRMGGDKTAPTVKITSPTNSATVSGIVNIQVGASDNVSVSQVSTSIDGVALSSSTASPYSFSWNTSGVTSGTHTISATARDAAGNSSSTSVQVGINATVNGDVTAPTVTITSPSSGSSVTAGATVTVAASASDNVGVSAVSFSVDGTSQSTSSSSPYTFPWNTTNLASGTHTLTATAKDAAGNTASSSVLVTINTIVLPPPALPSIFSLIMPPVQNQGGEGICVPFATTYAARSVDQFYKTNASSYNDGTNIFSPEFIYDQIKTSDCGSGTGVVTALDFLVNSGVCTWQSMPYSSSNGCSLIPTISQTSEAASYKITSYSKIAVSDVTAMKTMVVNKHALIITVGTDNSFWNATPGFIWKSYSGPMGISHALVICGFDDAKHAYKVMNSWGTTWGEAGFSWIDYDFLPQCAAYYSYVING